jgi:hypothetical protein
MVIGWLSSMSESISIGSVSSLSELIIIVSVFLVDPFFLFFSKPLDLGGEAIVVFVLDAAYVVEISVLPFWKI